MASVFDSPVIMIMEPRKRDDRQVISEILNPGGIKLADLRLHKKPLHFSVLKSIGLKLNPPFEIDYLDAVGRVILKLKKPFSPSKFEIDVFNEIGNKIGIIERKGKGYGHSGFFFNLLNNEGESLATLKGDWKGWNIQIIDARGILVGRITKRYAEVNKVIYAKSNFFIVQINEEIKDDVARKLVMGASGAMDFIHKE